MCLQLLHIAMYVYSLLYRPMYVASNVGDHLSVAEDLRTHIEPLLKVPDSLTCKVNYSNSIIVLQTYNVDLALWAHHHSYQRTCPVLHQKCRTNRQAPVHVVVGVGGQEISTDLIPYVSLECIKFCIILC